MNNTPSDFRPGIFKGRQIGHSSNGRVVFADNGQGLTVDEIVEYNTQALQALMSLTPEQLAQYLLMREGPLHDIWFLLDKIAKGPPPGATPARVELHLLTIERIPPHQLLLALTPLLLRECRVAAEAEPRVLAVGAQLQAEATQGRGVSN